MTPIAAKGVGEAKRPLTQTEPLTSSVVQGHKPKQCNALLAAKCKSGKKLAKQRKSRPRCHELNVLKALRGRGGTKNLAASP